MDTEDIPIGVSIQDKRASRVAAGAIVSQVVGTAATVAQASALEVQKQFLENLNLNTTELGILAVAIFGIATAIGYANEAKLIAETDGLSSNPFTTALYENTGSVHKALLKSTVISHLSNPVNVGTYLTGDPQLISANLINQAIIGLPTALATMGLVRTGKVEELSEVMRKLKDKIEETPVYKTVGKVGTATLDMIDGSEQIGEGYKETEETKTYTRLDPALYY